ncbi:MAG TPA: DUF2235 domain-containing protein [Thermoanaerobaculia bacterium]|nr:DUF2235 domain-containing protein [Thermoanaerobaculia bacterium]
MTTRLRRLVLTTIVFAIGYAESSNAICERSNGPQKLVVLFDGTWNGDSSKTNVGLLATEIGTIAKESTNIHSLYVPGVGTDFRRFSGGSTGWGFARKVRSGYSYIAECYEDGDQIYIFGFSRGAFEARTLAAMIQQVGILNYQSYSLKKSGKLKGMRDDVEEAYKIMKSAGKEAYFKRVGKKFPSTPSDRWRGQITKDEAVNKLDAKGLEGKRRLNRASITLVGVWDTVGALGLKHREKESLYLIGLEDLPDLKYAYQALSIDETRPSFWPVPWTEAGFDRPGQTSEEVWFPGGHADVGGGWADVAKVENGRLADISLNWMAGKLRKEGLVRPDFARWSEEKQGKLAVAIRHIKNQPLKDPERRDIKAQSQIHASVCDRMAAGEETIREKKHWWQSKRPQTKMPYRPLNVASSGGTLEGTFKVLDWNGDASNSCSRHLDP